MVPGASTSMALAAPAHADMGETVEDDPGQRDRRRETEDARSYGEALASILAQTANRK